MAGDELAKIKAENFPHTRYIVADIRANMTPKPVKAPVPDEEWDEDDDDVASYDSTASLTDGCSLRVFTATVSSAAGKRFSFNSFNPETSMKASS
ncbi:hypothetical protein E8E11_006482 [Didymella keratinophila]|nr:hypothetical protein E8E11_006482 [Didymella keratinophila]